MVTIYSRTERYVKSKNHSTVSTSEAEPPGINLLPTDHNCRISKGNDSTSHRTLKTVTRNRQSNNQDLENGSETSSAKRRIEEKMNNFENEFGTKLQLERTQSERKKLELKMQMKKLVMQHPLWKGSES